ncbi:hypothetical protein [Actinomyces howellii]|nr:hypothetical protein [Actinomyces howellii]
MVPHRPAARDPVSPGPARPLVVITSCAVGQAIRRSTPSWVVALGILGLDQVVPWVSDLVRAGLDSSLSTDGITPVEWCELYQGCLMIACGVMAALECARRCDPPAGVVLLAGFSAFIVTIAAYSMVSARIANSVSPAYDESDLRLPTVLRSGIQVQYSAAEPLDVMGAWLTTGLALVLGTVALRLITSRRHLAVLRALVVPGLIVCVLMSLVVLAAPHVETEAVWPTDTLLKLSVGETRLLGAASLLTVYSSSVTRWFTGRADPVR